MIKPNRKKRLIMIPLGITFVAVFAFLIYNTVFYPADETARAALVSDGNVIVSQTGYGYFFDGPSEENLFIFYPGAKVDEVAYAPLLRKLAERGMDVCLVHMPFHFALYNQNKAGSLLSEYTTYGNYYIGGHSLGGAMASIYASGHGDLLSGVILLAAYPTKPLQDSLTEISIYGSEDGVLNFDKLEESKKYAPAESYCYVIQGGNHAGFGNYGPQHGDSDAVISKEEQQNQTAGFILSSLFPDE